MTGSDPSGARQANEGQVPQSVRWIGGEDGHLEILDQTLLPGRREHVVCRDVATVIEAIRMLRVRGAPAIGIAGAYGLLVAAGEAMRAGLTPEAARSHVLAQAEEIATARPTAVNLRWAVERSLAVLATLPSQSLPQVLAGVLLAEARGIHEEDRRLCAAIGRHGAAVLPEGGVLTHCNTGALATGGAGTALAVITTAWEQGRRFEIFADETRPLLQERCVECHGAEKQKADLRLDAKSHAFHGGENGASIVPGDSAKSSLFTRVSTDDEDERMPPKGAPLTPSQIHALKEWIDSGAVWPENEADKAAATDKRLEHFAFQPIQDPLPSLTHQASRLTHPIDHFIRQKLAEKSLNLSPEADRRTLLRRLHFIVTGLAPTLEEVRAFEKDTDPKAYEKRVDALLASRHYGEKWARHWLDVVRFADSNGFETNHERPNAWRYRDYVIDAFNSDKPYDRFMFEQIAGDTVGQDVATGFIVAGPWDRVKGKDKNLQLMQRADELSDMVNATGTAFLGLTMGCAKCHNHKFDPIPQTDFYAMQAVFSGVQHGDRTIRPSDFEQKQKLARELERQLEPITAKLASFQPKAMLGRRIVIDDEPVLEAATDGATCKELVKATSGKPILYDPGTEKGQSEDPGDATRFPNFAASYRYFTEEPGTDCFR